MSIKKQIASDFAKYTIQAISIAKSENSLNTEEDLQTILEASIETAIEEYIVLNTNNDDKANN